MTKSNETAPGGMNESASGTSIDTELTQPGSADVLAQTRSDLTLLRKKHGALTPIGHRCSNWLEMEENLPRPPEEWIDYLMPDWVPVVYGRLLGNMRRTTFELAGLLAAARS